MEKSFTGNEITSLCAEAGMRPPEASYVVFVGFGHSGHSLLGALLDAHPNAAIANELNVLKQVRCHQLNFEQAWQLTRASVATNYETRSWINTGYQYYVEGGFHGIVEDLKVLGDKKGGGTARMILKCPKVWRKFVTQAGSCLRVVCVLRHPLDMLASAAYHRETKPDKPSLKRIVKNAKAVLVARESVGPEQFYCVRHEDFLMEPRIQLRQLCDFLELEVEESYITACMKRVRPLVNQRRFEAEWPDGLLDKVEKRLSRPKLKGLFSSYLPLKNNGDII